MGTRVQSWFRAALMLSTCLWSSAAGAELVIGNYPPTNDDSQVNIDDGLAVAVGFTMPAGSGVPLTEVKVRLAADGAVTSFSADLFGDSGGAPTNPILVSFTDPASFPTGSCVDYILTPTSAFTLQASTTYWLRLRGDVPTGQGDLRWCRENPFPGKAYNGIATSAGSFQNFTEPPASNLASSPGNLYYQVGEQLTVAEIPVLGRWGLGALTAFLGLAAAVALRRRIA